MKSAIILSGDWPGDEVVLSFSPEEFARLREHLDAHPHAPVGDRVLVLIGRTGFRVLHRYLVSAHARSPQDTDLCRLKQSCDLIAGQLRRDREDDRSGDPLPGSALAAALAEEMGETVQ